MKRKRKYVDLIHSSLRYIDQICRISNEIFLFLVLNVIILFGTEFSICYAHKYKKYVIQDFTLVFNTLDSKV